MKKERIFWGIFLILGAVFIIAAKLGFMQGIPAWTLIWTVIFAAIFIKCLIGLHYFGIFMSLALLAILYAEQLHIEAVTPWPVLGAAALLGIGLTMIFPKKHFKHWEKFGHCGPIHCENSNNIVDDINFETDENCTCSVNMGSSVKYIKSDCFESGRFEASFGSMKVYLDNAVMKGNEANIQVENSFGGMELYIPRAWKVISHVDNSFGGIDEKGHCDWDGIHTLNIYGENSFGGITIYYV